MPPSVFYIQQCCSTVSTIFFSRSFPSKISFLSLRSLYPLIRSLHFFFLLSPGNIYSSFQFYEFACFGLFHVSGVEVFVLLRSLDF